jgi:hypothetical protein
VSCNGVMNVVTIGQLVETVNRAIMNTHVTSN